MVGLGFWVPAMLQGFAADLPSAPCSAEDNILWYEALTMLTALLWAAELPKPPKQLAIYTDNLNTVHMFDSLWPSISYEDIIWTACDSLMSLHIDIQVWHVPGVHNTITNGIGYLLPTHKADCLFDGSRIIIEFACCDELPLREVLLTYFTSRDQLFPFHPTLFVTAQGNISTRSWFL